MYNENNSKKGFTLVELVLSITLLSIVLVFMMTMLVNLKDKENSNGADAKLLVNQAIISKAVNGDIISFGLEMVSPCASQNCYIFSFNNGSEKTLKLMSDNQTLFYGNETTTEFVRTLPNGRKYSSIHYYFYSNLEIVRVSVGKIYRNEDYDIEIYNYMGNRTTDTGGYISSGLLLHLDAINNTGNNSHNAVTSQWSDLSGNGNNATLHGMIANNPNATSGWTENGLLLDGVDDGVYLGDLMEDIFKQSFTFEITFSKSDLNNKDILLSNCNEEHCNQFEITAGNKNKVSIDNGTFSQESIADVFDMFDQNETTTLAYVYDRNTGKISTYKNGSPLQVFYSESIPNFSEAFTEAYIGKDGAGSSGNAAFKGKIYAVRVYGFALSDTKLMTNASIDKVRFQNQIVYTKTDDNSPVTFKPTTSGFYRIELWGARGGDITKSGKTYRGGDGGYTAGTVQLTANENIYFYIGTKPTDETNTNASVGGFNGGGGLTEGQYTAGRSGGGATDMRVTNGEWNNEESLRSRVMVAGGGGGANYRDEGYGEGNGGAGGGISGLSGTSINFETKGWGHQIGTGGTQENGGHTISYAGTNLSDADSVSGSFGYAASDSQAGGGGGYYGGGSSAHGGAGGGSSFISGHVGCVAIRSAYSSEPMQNCVTGTTVKSCSLHFSRKTFTSTLMIDGTGKSWTNVSSEYHLMPSPTGGYYPTGSGNRYDGYVRITFLGTKR